MNEKPLRALTCLPSQRQQPPTDLVGGLAWCRGRAGSVRLRWPARV